ncbi:MAG: hypothetical protein LBS95_00605 [Mycoplasmataceae bacterium]|nr:hypothetical protein [Mycoplasmataceae bacterium]
MKIYSQKNFWTKKWIICAIVFISFLFFLIIWLLFGQFDLLNMHWLIGVDGVIWKGYVTTQNINWLNETYSLNLTSDNVGEYIQVINNSSVIFNLNILWILLSILLLLLILTIILKLTKIINYDSFPLIFASNISFFIFFFIDLMPGLNNEILRNFVIIGIWSIVWLSLFFMLTGIFNKIVISNVNSFTLKKEYENEVEDIRENDEKIKKMLEKKQEYIEK